MYNILHLVLEEEGEADFKHKREEHLHTMKIIFVFTADRLVIKELGIGIKGTPSYYA